MRITLQPFVPSGQSLRWQAHQDYYQSEGLNVFFRQEVPYNITSNPCYAKQVAQLYLSQAQGIEPGATPALNILELGGGNGLFAHNFLNAFAQLAPETFQKLRYTLSDFSESMLQALAEHPAFAHWQAQGILRFEVVDASGKQETLATAQQWDGIIANYLFSTFPTEVVCKPGEHWSQEHTQLSLPLAPQWLQFIQEYLQQRDLSSPLPPDHPHYEVLMALFRAQQEVFQNLNEAMANDSDDEANASEIYSWLETQLMAAWKRELTAAPSLPLESLLETLFMLPLKQALAPHLWQSVQDAENAGESESVMQRRFFPLDFEALPTDHQRLLSGVSAFYPIAYAPEVLNALQFWRDRLSATGLFILSDKAQLNTRSEQTVQIARHGGTLSHALHWPLYQEALPGALYTDRPHHAVQTLCYSKTLTPALQSCFRYQWKDDPRHQISHALLEGGQALLQAGRMEAAYRSLKEALDYRPEDGTLQYFCALCCINAGDYGQALNILSVPHDDIFGLLNRDILKAEAYQATGQHALALPAYRASLKYGENALTYYQMARCYRALKKTEEALKHAREASALHPEDTDTQRLISELEAELK